MAGQPLIDGITALDAGFAAAIQGHLHTRGIQHTRAIRIISEQILEWLDKHGRMMRTDSYQFYYLYRDGSELIHVDSPQWERLLYRLTLINPKVEAWQQISASCRIAALSSELVELRKLANWDRSFLRVSAFDGTVYRLDGMTIEREPNGESDVIFDDRANWKPYDADLTAGVSAINDFLAYPNFEEPAEEYRLIWLAWIIALFFSELCPTQPILAALGEPGGGKSSAFRMMVRMLFGANNNVMKVQDKPEDFSVSIGSNHVIALDNFDSLERWQRDHIAGATTGTIEERRQLFTNNGIVTTTPVCWIALTTRTATVLRRDDIADRTIILPFIRRETFTAEHTLKEYVQAERGRWWGALLNLLNQVVASIKTKGIPDQSSLRMADFENIGQVVARVLGREDLWTSVVARWPMQQTDLVLENSLIPDALDAWLAVTTKRGKDVDSAVLYAESQIALFGANKPDKDWPQSSRSFGWTMKSLRRALQSRFTITWKVERGHTIYQIDILPSVVTP